MSIGYTEVQSAMLLTFSLCVANFTSRVKTGAWLTHPDARSHEAYDRLIMNVPAEKIAEVLGGQHVLGRSVHSMRELDVIVREGMPKSALDKFIAVLENLVHWQTSALN